MKTQEIRDAGFSILEEDISKAKEDVRTAITIFRKYAVYEDKTKAELTEAGEMLIHYFSILSDMQLTYTNEMILLNKVLSSALNGEDIIQN